MTDTKLKPCPFCGGEAEMLIGGAEGIGVVYQAYWIACKKCGAQTTKIKVSSYYTAENCAILAWNMREGEAND